MSVASIPLNLTRREQRILRALEDLIARHGYSPTVREIGEATGLKSPGNVHDALNALRRKGLVTWLDDSPRTFRPARIGG